ncbi:MAG: Bug family tripartite tricarboxylate transporter substrate binding protein [Burkholderiales bacterium]
MKLIVMVAAAFVTMLSVHPARAQAPFPSRTVTLINPNAPGGTGDIIGHGMTESLRAALKQPVILINRVGAGGAVGGAYVAQAPADGYTVLLNTVTHVLIPITDNLLGRSSGYTVDDFQLLARITADPLLLIVHPSIPAKTVKEFVALAKAKPGELIYSSTGVYGSGHIAMIMLARAADVNLVHSPFNGGGPAMTAVLGNHANAFFAPAGVANPHMQAGRVRALAQSGAKRAPLFPDLPTVKEAGYDADLTLWAGYFAPVKTPPAVVKVWQSALRESAQDTKFRDAMAKLNVTIDYLDGDALKVWYDDELKRLDREIRAIGRIESRT